MVDFDRKQLKQTVLNTIQNQINNIQLQITSLTHDAQNDAKSSAGDKHETGLAMMHLEQEKLNTKLLQLLNIQQTALKLPETKLTKKVTIGSVVKTNKGIFYISVPLQMVHYQSLAVFCVSVHAPLTQQLLNKQIKDKITFNSISYEIIDIF